MNLFKRTLSIIMILSIVLVSCKKDKEVISEEFQPTFKEKETIKIAPALSSNTDYQATTAYSSANTLKSYVEAYSALFNIPENAEKVGGKTAATALSGTWTWDYAYGGYTYTVLFTLDETSTQYQFNYDYQYDGTTFYKIEGWENIDQSAGHYNVEYVGYTDMDMDWNTTATGYHISMDYSYSGGSALNYDANYNNDGSGDFSQKLFGETYASYTATWDAAGHGTASYYDGSTGTLTDSYTF